eukprot:NODE_2224_length_2263_cov_16.902154.p1 GENE.NODE_2224_length_2263_cov_16.902154~~NODE_2224_length_2263_cov_16.902154.p1  ORF type:complete len:708 (-),score=174.21 NODE_2224_length_2263_cov_16.902154:139-1962(-)
MLPPSPPNTLGQFLADVSIGRLMPAMCHSDTLVDAKRYWDKRRVQNLLRRLREALQERFALDDASRAADLGNAAYDAMLEWAQVNGVFLGGANGAMKTATPQRISRLGMRAFEKETFIKALNALKLWPSEMSDADHSEVFSALLVPSSSTVRALSNGQSIPREVTRRMFCEGLTRLPFNLPDFPVPTHLLSPVFPAVDSKDPASPHFVSEIAQAIASLFCMDQTGMERVKDYFLCGLVSQEEIQAALPQLVQQNLVEQAVLKIIRASVCYFARHEWQALVVNVRMNLDAQRIEPYGDNPEALTPSVGSVSAAKESQGAGDSMQVQAATPVQHHEAAVTASEHALSSRRESEPGLPSDCAAYQVERQAPLEPGHGNVATSTIVAPEKVAAVTVPPIVADVPSTNDEAMGSDATMDSSLASCVVDWAMPSPGAAVASLNLSEGEASTCQKKGSCTGKVEQTYSSVMIDAGLEASTCQKKESRTGEVEQSSSSVMMIDDGHEEEDHGGHEADESAGTLQHPGVGGSGSEPQLPSAPPPTPPEPALCSSEASPPVVAAVTRRAAPDPQDPVTWLCMEMHTECRGPFLARAFVRCCQLYEVSIASASASMRQ